MRFHIRNILLLIVLTLGLVIFSACPNAQKYSEIPEIKFKQVILFDTIDDITLNNPVKGYKLRFGLIDGDGNIGLKEADTIGIDVDSLYYNNFITKMYEVRVGDTILVDSIDGYNFRIPYIEPTGQNKTLIADIYNNWTFTYSQDTLKYDSVFFEFFIIDRKLNKSNIEKTPVLSLKEVGVFPVIQD